MIDCAGNVVDKDQLDNHAAKLEGRVRIDVGTDNYQLDIPPGEKVPKFIEDILKDKEDRIA